EKKTTFNAKDMSERVYRWSLSSLHKQGYDEIEIIYTDPKTIIWTSDLVKNLFVGFVIINQTENTCVIRRVSQDLTSEFDAGLRRSFLVTSAMGESMIDYMKREEYSKLADLIPLEKTNNQLTNFCERLLNKMGHKNYDKTCFYYTLVWNNEKICDDYKYVCQYISTHDKTKYSKEILLMLEKSLKYYKDFCAVLFNWDIKKLDALNTERKVFLKKLEEHFSHKNPHELVVTNYLLSFISKIDDFSASAIAINQRDDLNIL
ncbi:MAG: hypothetical protein KKG59_02175, partial [Nanoarchaeota archaeon]|nr:hypothetical protein [Nanoarchaeota archaeon]